MLIPVTIETLNKMPTLKILLIEYLNHTYEGCCDFSDESLVNEFHNLYNNNRVEEVFFWEYLNAP
jgi:hypothetical protein